MGGVGGDVKAWPECSHKYAYDYGTTCNAKFNRGTHSGNHQRNAPEYEPEDYARENGKQIRIAKFFFLVSKHLGHIVYSLGLPHNSEFVAHLKPEIA